MKREIKVTQHAVERFNERIGQASVADVIAELHRADPKHFGVIHKRKTMKHLFIPSPVAVFVGCIEGGRAIIKTVLKREAA